MSMKTKKIHEGYLMIDNRFGPGVSEDLIKSSGRDASIVGPGVLFESATITCSHCQFIVILNPDRSRERHYCSKCDHYICDGCSVLGECLPMQKVFDDLQNQAIKLLNIKEI